MSRTPATRAIVLCTMGLASCSSKENVPAPIVPPPLLYVAPPAAEVTAGGTPATFTALLRGASGTIAWTLQPPNVGSLSATAGDVVVYTPPAAIAIPTSVTLTAQGAGMTDAAVITVTPAPPAVAVTPAAACIVAGSGARTFVAAVAAGPGVITWSIDPPDVGTLSSSTGTAVTYTPPAALEAAVAVTLTARAASAEAGSATIILLPDLGHPAAILQSISPTRAIAGGPGLALTVDGANFLPDAVVRWNGADRPTRFVSPSRLVATIPQRDVARAGATVISVSHQCAASVATIPFAVGHRLVSQVSVATNGTQPRDWSMTNDALRPATSADGRYVAFVSHAPNLVPGDATTSDVFVRDTCFGAPPGCAPSTERVRVRNNLETDLTNPTITPDGRFVALNGWNAIYLADTCRGAPAGCAPTTEVVSVASDGSPGTDPTPWDPYDQTNDAVMSADGRFVAFCSDLAFAPDDTNTASDVYVRDTCRGAPQGCSPSTSVVSLGPSGAVGGHYASISEDGRFVGFVSGSSELVAADTNGELDLFVRDTCHGAPPGCTPATERVSLGAAQQEGNGPLHHGHVAPAGRLVFFASEASNLVPGDLNGQTDVFVRDTCRGASPDCVATTDLVSVSTSGSQAAGESGFPQASADGRFVVFFSGAPDLVPDDTNGMGDVFLRDTCRGAPPDCTPSTIRLSIAPDGAQLAGEGPAAFTFGASISADGRAVVFRSGAPNLLPQVAGWNVFQVATCAVAGTPECEPGGSLRVTTATTGTDVDADGFGVRLHGVAAGSWTTLSVPPQGTAVFHALPPGTYELTLVGLSANCDPVTSPRTTVTVVAGNTTDASFSVSCESETLIAFEYAPAGQWGVTLYEASSGGGNSYEINYNGSSSEWDPDWAPHVRGIAFTSEWHASICWGVHRWIAGPYPYFLMSASCLDDPVAAYAPSWKPDGSRLAFTSERDGNAEIYLVNPGWTDPVRLTNDPAADLAPAWSPDGTRIAFARADAAGSRIVVMNSDGTGQTLLTSDDAEETDPAWSPDGSEIAYSRRTCRDGTTGRGCDPWDVYVRHDDGTIEPVALGSPRADALDPAWSPDGRKIAYTYRLRDSATELHDHDSAVALVRVDGTGPVFADPLRDEFMLWRGEDPSWRW